MRVARSVRLLIVFAVLGAVMVLGSASASAFSLSSSTSTTQAAAPTDLSYAYVASGSQSLSRLDVDLPPGVMHDATAPAICATATYETDRCPSWSLAGSVSARMVVLGSTITVPGSIYRVADSADASTFEFGIVLRPPFSAFGLTSKKFLKGRATISGNGSLRHSITGDLSSVSLFGISLRSRITRLGLSFAASNENGNQLYNSTSCASQPLRATAAFSDGSSESQSSPYSTTGCALVPFTSTALTTLDNPRPGVLESFAVQLNPGNAAARGQLHDSHVKNVEVDFSSLGTFDTEMLAAMPGCPSDLQLQLRCPEESRVGSFSTGVKWFAPELKGALYRSAESPTGLVGVLDLPGDRIIGFKIEIDGVIQGSKSLQINIPVQLPLEATVVKIDAPILKLHQKPASCSTRESRAVLSGHSGGWSISTSSFPGEPCPPSVATVDPIDDDDDGDGWADDELRAENFRTRIVVTAEGQEIDASSARCELSSPDPATAVRGKIRIVRDPGNGYTCEVTEAAGQVTVEFSIASVGGHVTVLKRSFTVDSEPPVITSAVPEPIDSASDSIELPFEFTDDRLSHPQSSYTGECALEDEAGNRTVKIPRIELMSAAGSGDGECMWDSVRRGKYLASITLQDNTGHVTVLKRTAVVDSQGPVITLTDIRDQDDDGDGLPTEAIRLSAFDIPFSVGGDDDIDDSSISCKLINPVAMDKDLRVADLDGDGRADVCQVTDAPGGPITVEVSAADHRGHVTVLKLAYTVDTEAPTIETTAPDKVVYDLSTFDFEFEFTDDTHDHPQSKIKPGAEIEMKVGGTIESAKIVVDRDTGRSKGFARFENVPDGDHVMSLSAEDSTGHVTVLKVAFTVDAQGPTIRVSPSLDSDDDGIFDSEFTSSSFDVPFTLSDLSEIDPASVRCSVRDYNWRVTARSTRGDGSVDPTPDYWCAISEATDGPFELEISAADVHGHVTVLKLSGEVDTTGPVIRLINPEGIDNDGDGTFEETRYVRTFDRAVSVEDHADLDKATVKCTVRGWDPTSKEQVSAVDLTGDGIPDVCRISDAPDGLHLLEVSAADVHGHVTVLKLAITVDATPPAVTILSPTSGQTFSSGSLMNVRFTTVAESPINHVCRIDSFVVDSACTPTDSFLLGGLSAGAHVFSVAATDSRGRSSTSSVTFNISEPSPDVCIAIYPPPPGCPGYIPPGGIIIVP